VGLLRAVLIDVVSTQHSLRLNKSGSTRAVHAKCMRSGEREKATHKTHLPPLFDAAAAAAAAAAARAWRSLVILRRCDATHGAHEGCPL